MSVLRHIKDVPIPQGVGGVVSGVGLIRVCVCVCVCRVPLSAWSLRVRVCVYMCVCIYEII